MAQDGEAGSLVRLDGGHAYLQTRRLLLMFCSFVLRTALSGGHGQLDLSC
jgi:hypothetical protein